MLNSLRDMLSLYQLLSSLLHRLMHVFVNAMITHRALQVHFMVPIKHVFSLMRVSNKDK
jgi:hypothetical protein